MTTWNDVLAPFYSGEFLQQRGLELEGLIGLNTADGEIVYPHAQFDVALPDRINRRETVLGLWNELIKPVIDEGYVDEWTATALLLQSPPGGLSEADRVSDDPGRIDELRFNIVDSVRRFRQ